MKKILSILILFSQLAIGQTRLYFPLDTQAPITNVAFDGVWDYTSEAVKRKLADTKGSSTITTGTQIGPWTTTTQALDRQYVSTRMAAGAFFESGVTTFSLQLMVREYAAADNVDRLYIIIRIVSEDGNTVRATLESGVSSTGEFINNATHRNKWYQSTANTINASYTTVAGDRLVVEIGYTDSGATPEASAKWGENATDLPVNETQTTDGAGWIEFTGPEIVFIGEPVTRRLIIVN